MNPKIAQKTLKRKIQNGALAKVPESAGLVGVDLALLSSAFHTIDNVTSSLGHCATPEDATAAGLRGGRGLRSPPPQKV